VGGPVGNKLIKINYLTYSHKFLYCFLSLIWSFIAETKQ